MEPFRNERLIETARSARTQYTIHIDDVSERGDDVIMDESPALMNIIDRHDLNGTDDSSQEVTLRQCFEILWRRRVIIGYSSALVAITGAAITLLTPPTFRASAYLLVKPSGISLNQVDAANPLSDLFSANQPYKIETQVRELQSGDLIDAVNKKIGNSGKTAPVVGVKSILETDIIEVDVDASDPRRAAKTANAILDTYLNNSASANGLQVRSALKFTEEGAAKAQNDLEHAENNLRKFEQRYKVSELDKNRAADISAVEGLEVHYTDLQAKRAAATSQLATLSHEISTEPRTATDVLSAAADPAVQATETQIATLGAQRAGLAKRYTPVNKQIVALDAQIAALKHYLLQQRTAVTARNEHKNPAYAAMVARRSLLQEQLSGMVAESAATSRDLSAARGRMGSYPAWQQEYAGLERHMEIAKANYALLSTKREDLRLRDQTRHVDARVMEYAKVPDAPIRPKKALGIVLALLAGLVVGVILGVIQEYFDDRINSPEEAERHFRVPTLGLLPMVTEEGFRLINNTAEYSPLLESYRSLRTNIGFAAVDNPVRTLLITSSAPLEGKSTVATNLAIAMSLDGRKVVVVDADLRRPTLHKQFNLRQTPGLTDLLLGTHGLGDVLQVTGTTGVRLIGAGSFAPNPVELLASESMARVIDGLRGVADIIIFDSPPTLAVSDSAMLSARVDGVLFVASHAETKRGNASLALRQLSRARANVIGVVINKINKSGIGYYGKAGYAYTSSGMLGNGQPSQAILQSSRIPGSNND